MSLLFILFGIWPCISQVVMLLLHCGILSVGFCPKTWIPGVRWLKVSLQLLYSFKHVSLLHGCKILHLEQNQLQVYFLSLTLWWRKAREAPDFETRELQHWDLQHSREGGQVAPCCTCRDVVSLPVQPVPTGMSPLLGLGLTSLWHVGGSDRN